jgi:hypothetical protein
MRGVVMRYKNFDIAGGVLFTVIGVLLVLCAIVLAFFYVQWYVLAIGFVGLFFFVIGGATLVDVDNQSYKE